MIAGEPVTAPALERAGLNSSACVAHQRNEEMYIVEAQEAQAEDLFRDEQVADVGLGEAPAGRTGALVVKRRS